jgi:hypothetical protein
MGISRHWNPEDGDPIRRELMRVPGGVIARLACANPLLPTRYCVPLAPRQAPKRHFGNERGLTTPRGSARK